MSTLPTSAATATESSTQIETLLAALETFDGAIGPQGLYAAREHGVVVKRPPLRYEWSECITPCLNGMGWTSTPLSFDWQFRCHPETAQAAVRPPNEEEISLHFIRLTKIRVRKYGDRYRIDPHQDFSERWKELNIASFLKQCRPQDTRFHMLVFLGFDRNPQPFRQQFAELRDKRCWEKLGWTLQSRTWLDPHDRGFYTTAAIWTPTSLSVTEIS